MRVGSGTGYRAVLAKYHEMGFALEGSKSPRRMFRKNGTLGRAEESGSKRARRTPDTVESARHYMEENPISPCGDAVSALDMGKTAMRTILTQDLDTRPLRQVETQRAKSDNSKKRLGICKIREGQLESGELDVEKIFFHDEKLFRLGACSGEIEISPRT